MARRDLRIRGDGEHTAVTQDVRLPDGRILDIPAPLAPRMFLDAAASHRDRAIRNLESLEITYGLGNPYPADPSRVIDCMSDLATAVFLSCLAVEAFANEVIELLEDLPGAVAIVPTRDGERAIRQPDMGRLRIVEKLRYCIGLYPPCKVDAGTAQWGAYALLKRLRNDLTHLKERGYSGAPLPGQAREPGEFERLIGGEGHDCVEVATNLIDAIWPGWLAGTPSTARRQ